MKKFTLMLLAFLGVLGVNATELWTGSTATGDWKNNVTVEKGKFTSAAAGNVLKVTFSNYATKKEDESAVTYWGFAFKKMDSGWNALTGFVDGNLTQNSESACFRLSAENVTELQTYGLAVQGYYITISKVELLTVTSTETIYSDATGVSTGNYANVVNLAYENKGKFSEALMNDFIAVTYAATADGEVRIANPEGWNAYTNSSKKGVSEGNSGVFVYAIPNASILEGVQIRGAIVYGQYITITKVELLKGSNRYDVVPATIGADGIATFSSSKKLDFAGTGVTPYYASAYVPGSVTLTSVEKTASYAGYVLKGAQGNYDIPVIDEEVPYPASSLRGTGDYPSNIYKSVYSDYSGGGTDATNIQTKYRYIFAKNGSDIGFYLLPTDFTNSSSQPYHVLAAHKAYLETTTDIAPSARVALNFDDEETTGVNEISSLNADVSGDYYDLMGRKVAQPTRGLYIVNGKKVIIK